MFLPFSVSGFDGIALSPSARYIGGIKLIPITILTHIRSRSNAEHEVDGKADESKADRN